MNNISVAHFTCTSRQKYCLPLHKKNYNYIIFTLSLFFKLKLKTWSLATDVKLPLYGCEHVSMKKDVFSSKGRDTHTMWAKLSGFSGWSGNMGCKGSRLEAQLRDLLNALVSFLAGDF